MTGLGIGAGDFAMATIRARDGTEIHDIDRDRGQKVVLSHDLAARRPDDFNADLLAFIKA
jgi:hypothetical protein